MARIEVDSNIDKLQNATRLSHFEFLMNLSIISSRREIAAIYNTSSFFNTK